MSVTETIVNQMIGAEAYRHARNHCGATKEAKSEDSAKRNSSRCSYKTSTTFGVSPGSNV